MVGKGGGGEGFVVLPAYVLGRSDLKLCLQAPFEELQPDAVSAQVLKYAKAVYQMEKGLPPNGAVPALKAKVEEMREKVRHCGGTMYM